MTSLFNVAHGDVLKLLTDTINFEVQLQCLLKTWLTILRQVVIRLWSSVVTTRSGFYLYHYNDVTWEPYCLKSPAMRLFFNSLFVLTKKTHQSSALLALNGGNQHEIGGFPWQKTSNLEMISSRDVIMPGEWMGVCSFIVLRDRWAECWIDGYMSFNTLRPRQNGRHFADDNFKRIFMNENVRISTNISMKFVPKSLIDNIPALVQIMAWRRPDDKPLSEPMMVNLLTHICALGLNELMDGG